MTSTHRWLLAIFAIAVALIALPKEALALTASASASNYTGACPGAVAFSGTISGTSGTAVTYYFFYYDPGSGKTISLAPHSTTIAGGSVPVADTGTVTGSGSAWMQLLVTSPGTTYSNKANFTVACTAPPPPPTSAPCSYCKATQPNSLIRPSIVLHSKWWGVRAYEYKWVGIDFTLPEGGTCESCGPPTVGWYHHKTGDSFWLWHQNDYYRAFFAFDQAQMKGMHVTKATLTTKEIGGRAACFGAVGRATTWAWVTETSHTFNAPYPIDGDFSIPVPAQVNGSGGTFDVTQIVQGWASGKFGNLGFVLRGSSEDNGSDGNDSCTLAYAGDAVLTINQ